MTRRITREMQRKAALEYRVVGVHCVSCKNTIEKEVSKLPGVEKVTVDPATRIMRVEAGENLDFDVLRKTVSRLGYDLEASEAVIRVASRDPLVWDRAKETLSRLDGVYTVSVSHDGAVRIVYDPAATSPKAVEEALENAGIPIESWREQSRSQSTTPLLAGLGALVYLAGLLLGIPALHALGGLIALAGAVPAFIVPAAKALYRGYLVTDTLLSIGVLSSLALSLYGVFTGGPVYWEAIVFITFFVVAGRYVEESLRARALERVSKAASLLPKEALVKRGRGLVRVSVDDVRPGDVVVVPAGESVPVDGRVLAGSGLVEESVITGESEPRSVEAGDIVYAGSILVGGRLEVTALRTGEWRLVERIARSTASTVKTRLQEIADRVVRVFVPLVLAVSIATIAAHTVMGVGWEAAVIAGVTVLVVACPCALGIAIPAAASAYTLGLARKGIVVVNPGVLEKLASPQHIVFDKTGTLTLGRPRVARYEILGMPIAEVASLVLTLEEASSHPVAKALREWALENDARRREAESIDEIPGKGVVASMGGRLVVLGRRELVEEASERVRREGVPPGYNVYLVVGDRLVAAFLVEDEVRREARSVIEELLGMGVNVHVISGDDPVIVSRVAEELGVPPGKIVGGADPFEKASRIEELRREGVVVYVGDGVNDAPAMAAADVGIAVGNAADLARSASDLYLERASVGVLPWLIRYSRRAGRILRLNLFWAFAYNAVLIPVAAGVLSWAGVTLTPAMAAAAMSLSSMTVTLTSLTLLRG